MLMYTVDRNTIVFISFKWGKGEGEDLKDYLHDCLQKKGITAWIDTENIQPGDTIKDEIKQGIEACSLFVSLMSPGYFKSRWCKDEFILAIDHRKPIFPIEWSSIDQFQYPPEILDKRPDFADVLRHRYNTEPVNMKAEKATCAAKIIQRINGRN